MIKMTKVVKVKEIVKLTKIVKIRNCWLVGWFIGRSVCDAFAFWLTRSNICRVYGLVLLKDF